MSQMILKSQEKAVFYASNVHVIKKSLQQNSKERVMKYIEIFFHCAQNVKSILMNKLTLSDAQ